MRYLIIPFLLVLFFQGGLSSAELGPLGSLAAETKLAELASLPQGLQVSHSPDQVETSFFGPSGIQWAHRTSVTSTVGPVTIIEYGFLLERDGSWTDEIRHQSRFTAKEFAENFDSPGAKVQPGKTYTDRWNQSMADNIPEQVGKWYFIGLDAQGQRVKGEADIKLVGNMTEDGC